LEKFAFFVLALFISENVQIGPRITNILRTRHYAQSTRVTFSDLDWPWKAGCEGPNFSGWSWCVGHTAWPTAIKFRMVTRGRKACL